MKRDRRVMWIVRSVGVLAVVVGLAAPTAFGAPPVQVNEAIPNTGEQGTTNLAVTIKGKNFDQSSVARFFVSGTTNPGGVTVNATAFQDSKTLLVDLTIDDAAELELFDIEVELLSSGRKGKGTEKFQVTPKGGGPNQAIEVCAMFRNDVADGIQSDVLSDTYCHDAEPNLYVVIGGNAGRFNLWTDKTSREAILDFPDCGDFIPDATCSTVVSFNTLNEWVDNGLGGLESTGQRFDLRTLDPGESTYVDFQASFPSPSKSTPHLVVYGGSNHDWCGDPALATRVDDDTWTFEATTQLGCLVEIEKKGNRRIVHHPGTVLPFKITLVRQ